MSLPCAFHSISSNVDATHAPTWSTMIWSILYHHVIILVHRSWLQLLFTVAFIHWRQVLLKLHRHAVHRSKAFDLPFTLATGPSSQVLSWSSPSWSHDLMSCLMCNKLLHHHMCALCNIFEPSSSSWHMLLTHMYLWTNHLYISHKHILVHLGCPSITKIKQGPFIRQGSTVTYRIVRAS